MFHVYKKKYALLFIGFLLLLSITACTSSGISDTSSSSSSQNNGDITIPAGKLHEYSDSYSSYRNVNVRMKDGTTDSRANDLEELCKDWLYYRKKIVDADNAGEFDKAADHRESFQRVNAWLDDYYDSDVTTMFEILEKQGYNPP